MEWTEIKIGDVLSKIIGGGTPSKANPEYWNGNIPWCSVKDMADDKFQLSTTEDFITDLGLSKSSSNLIPKGSVITSTRMGLGRAFVNNVDMAINQDLKALIPNEKIDNKYLLWCIVSKKEELNSLGTGSTVKGIRLETFKEIKILLPHLPIQRKIASILSAYDDLIETNLNQIKLLEELAQRTYEEWFVKFRLNGKQLKLNKESNLPVGWLKKRTDEFCNFSNGYAYYTKGYSESGYIILDLGNVGENSDLKISGKEKFISKELYNATEKFHLKKHDVIIAMTDVTSALRILGKTAVVDKDNAYALNQRVGCLRSIHDEIDYSIIYALFNDTRFLEKMKAVSKGAVQFYFNTKDVVEYEHVIPTNDFLKAFKEIYKPFLELRVNLKNQNQKLRESRNILLPKLMNGTIELK